MVDLDEAVNVLVPQTPERLKELLGFTLSKPSTVTDGEAEEEGEGDSGESPAAAAEGCGGGW